MGDFIDDLTDMFLGQPGVPVAPKAPAKPAPKPDTRKQIALSVAEREKARLSASKPGDPGYVPTLEEYQAQQKIQAEKQQIVANSLRKAQDRIAAPPPGKVEPPKVQWLKDNILPGQLPGDKPRVAAGGSPGPPIARADVVQQPEIAKDDD